MLLALLLAPAPRAEVWVAMLVWMGCACILNARRCGRTHCRYTAPFFLGMATLVTAYAAGMVSLGNQPWLLLGIVIGAGNALIWWNTERILAFIHDSDGILHTLREACQGDPSGWMGLTGLALRHVGVDLP
jgi:hypothetical protein